MKMLIVSEWMIKFAIWFGFSVVTQLQLTSIHGWQDYRISIDSIVAQH